MKPANHFHHRNTVRHHIFLFLLCMIFMFSIQTVSADDTTGELVTGEITLFSEQHDLEKQPDLIQFGILVNRFTRDLLEKRQAQGTSEFLSEKGIIRITASTEDLQWVKKQVDLLSSAWGGYRQVKGTKNKILFLNNHDVNISTMLWGAYHNDKGGYCQPLAEIKAVFLSGPDDYITNSIDFFQRYDQGIRDILIKSYPIWWGNGHNTVELLEAALTDRGYTPPRWSDRLHLQIGDTEEVLRVIDRQYIHDIIERLLSDPAFIQQAAPGNTTLQEFFILSPQSVGKKGTIVSLAYFQHAVMGIEALLYGQSGERRAHLDGRAMTTNYSQASIQVLDTAKNLERVDKFVSEFLQIPPQESVSVQTLNFLTASEGATYLKEANIGQTLTVLTSLGSSHLMVLGSQQEVRFADQYLQKLDTPAGQQSSGDQEALVIRYYYPQNRSVEYLQEAFSQQGLQATIQQTNLEDQTRIQLSGPKSIVEKNLEKLEALDIPPKSYLVNVYLLDLLEAQGSELENLVTFLKNTSPIKNTELYNMQSQQLLHVVCATNGYTTEDRVVSFGKKQPHLERLNIPQQNGWFVEITPAMEPENKESVIQQLKLAIYKDGQILASINERVLLDDNNRGEILIPAWTDGESITYGPWYLIVKLIEIQ